MRRVITIIICMLLLFGCQPTPMESAVVQKDGALEKTIEASPLSEYSFLHPDFIGESIQLSDKTKLTFETNIILEGISFFPVYRIKYLPFSTSEINSLLPLLFGKERVIQKSQVRSKGVIEQEIRYWEELRNKTLSGEEDGDLKTYESMLNTLYKEWNDAPEDPAYSAYDGEWKEQSLSLASETSDKTLEVNKPDRQSGSVCEKNKSIEKVRTKKKAADFTRRLHSIGRVLKTNVRFCRLAHLTRTKWRKRGVRWRKFLA